MSWFPNGTVCVAKKKEDRRLIPKMQESGVRQRTVGRDTYRAHAHHIERERERNIQPPRFFFYLPVGLGHDDQSVPQ